jgi:parallel beta-helix repeat protein
MRNYTTASNPVGYYVSPTGNDKTGNGTAADPFATLARAQNAMENSSIKTTYLESGTYDLTSNVNFGTADNGESVLAAPSADPILRGQGTLSNFISLNGTDDFTIKGLTFENTAIGDYEGAVTLNNANSNTIEANLFSNNDRGLLLNGACNNLISGNEINDSTTAGINAGNGSNGNTINSNIVNGVNVDSSFGTGTGSSGIWITGGDNNAITNNLVENTAGAAISMTNWDTNAADTANLNLNDNIANNDIVNACSSTLANDCGAIYIDGRSGADTLATINNNTVSLASSPTSGLNVGIYLDDFTSGATVTNNIVTGGNFGFLVHGGENNKISNNIFDDGTRTSYNIGAGLIQGESGGPIASMTGDVVDHNIIYSTATGTSNVWVNYGGAANISYNLYYNTNGKEMLNTQMDSNPKFGNPNFANEPAGNYALGAGSAASLIDFQQINQSAIGLAPTTSTWY